MPDSMTLSLWKALAVLLLLLPPLVSGVVALCWRRALAKPVAFFVLGTALLYFAYVLIGEVLFVPAHDAVIFIPATTAPPTGLSVARPLAPFFWELAPTPLALIAVSYPILRWLRSVLPARKAEATSAA